MMGRFTALVVLLLACALAGLAATTAAAGGPWRVSTVTAAPAPDDLALLEVSFPHARRERVSSATLRVAVPGPFGSDYMAAGALRVGSTRQGHALVLVVNRPSALLDPSEVKLRLRVAESLGAWSLRRAPNAFAHTAGPRPALCGLARHGLNLDGTDLAGLGSDGAGLSGFDAAAAISQAYDLACGLTYSSAFAEDVRHSGVSCGAGDTAAGTLCCPPGAMCVPAPSPEPVPTPVPQPPGCTPCDPVAGHACPLAARTAVCVADRRLSIR